MSEKKETSKDTTADSTKTVSSRKIFYCEIDDEVTMIFDRVKSTKLKDIYLVVPRQATIFQSLVNLKILKRKVEEAGKKIHIITDDVNGVHLTHQAGIPVYERLETQGGYVPTPEDEKMRITPLRATVNAVDDETPTRLSEKKLSISELLGRGRKRRIPLVSSALSFFKKEKSDKEMKFVVVSPNRQALIALITISFVLVLIIFYVALPGSTIYITPKSDVIDHTVNLTFADYDANKAELDSHPPNVLASHTITTTIHRTILQGASGKIFQGTNAKGRLTVSNTDPRPWPLIASTRFQTPDGVVFRLQQAVTIPGARGGESGSLDVDVLADQFDAYGQPVGARGNIPPTKLFLPGLSPENQKKISAASTVAFSGGTTAIKNKIAKEDLEAATNKLKQDLQSSVEAELTKAIQDKNAAMSDRAKFTLLTGKLAYTISDPRISLPVDVIDKEMDHFEASGEIDVTGIYFNLNDVLQIMKDELKIRKNPDKRIVKVDDSSITYHIFDVDNATKKYKVTANLKGLEEFDINPSRQAGERLIQKIKEHVVGRKIQDAKDYILNLPEVAAVDIKNWPVWAPTIPSIPDNISVQLVSSP
jgi:hypothetical protein